MAFSPEAGLNISTTVVVGAGTVVVVVAGAATAVVSLLDF
jgi:hypothetical protein